MSERRIIAYVLRSNISAMMVGIMMIDVFVGVGLVLERYGFWVEVDVCSMVAADEGQGGWAIWYREREGRAQHTYMIVLELECLNTKYNKTVIGHHCRLLISQTPDAE
jgi:hypothetical protein